MYILTIKGCEDDGAYAIRLKNGKKVLHLFENEDEAVRYAGLLEANGFPETEPIEVNEDIAVQACEHYGYNYAIIKTTDFVVPPEKVNSELI